ncbi:MAG: hypothetical protein HYV07_10445 [Deltaproteobacteria bacterium]|nr:hypothetical protein [Deltaproteobacteria bacterium]
MLSFVLISAAVGLHLIPGGDLLPDESNRLRTSLAAAVEGAAGLKVELAAELACKNDKECVTELLGRPSLSEVVIAKAVKGPRRIRVVASRHRVGVMFPVELSADLPVDGDWEASVKLLAESLFPPAQGVAANPALLESTPGEDEGIGIGLPVWIAYGVALAAGGTALGFGIANQSAQSRLEAHDYTSAEYHDLVSDMRTDGRIANVMFGVFAAGLATGAVLLLVDAL